VLKRISLLSSYGNLPCIMASKTLVSLDPDGEGGYLTSPHRLRALVHYEQLASDEALGKANDLFEKEYNLNQLALDHSFVRVDLILSTRPIRKLGLVKLLEQCGNGVRVISIARLLA
jgi:hypothetical protein